VRSVVSITSTPTTASIASMIRSQCSLPDASTTTSRTL
jgi:hypothetical protein